jgi:hypothetical protein
MLQRKYHCLATASKQRLLGKASKQLLLGKAYNNTDSDMFSVCPTLGYIRTAVSVEATWVCIPIGNSEVLLTAVYKSPGRAWSDADITELISFSRKSILTDFKGF